MFMLIKALTGIFNCESFRIFLKSLLEIIPVIRPFSTTGAPLWFFSCNMFKVSCMEVSGGNVNTGEDIKSLICVEV